MKCRIIRNDIEHVSRTPDVEQSEVRPVKRNGRMMKIRFWKVGAIIDDPKAYVLVKNGIAEPADKECEQRAGMTPEELAAAKHGADRLAAGIHPSDYDLFDRGVIVGYNGDGSYKLGPNGHELEEIDDEEDEGFGEE